MIMKKIINILIIILPHHILEISLWYLLFFDIIIIKEIFYCVNFRCKLSYQKDFRLLTKLFLRVNMFNEMMIMIDERNLFYTNKYFRNSGPLYILLTSLLILICSNSILFSKTWSFHSLQGYIYWTISTRILPL
jgi:hypothetical protein